MECIFCGEAREQALHRHHVYPKFVIDRFGLDAQEWSSVVIICHNCHAILHKMFLDPIEQVLRFGKRK